LMPRKTPKPQNPKTPQIRKYIKYKHKKMNQYFQ